MGWKHPHCPSPPCTNGVWTMNLKQFQKVVKFAQTNFLSLFSIDVKNNNTYSLEEYLGAFSFLCWANKSAYRGSIQLNLENNIPDGDSLLYTIKKCCQEDYHEMFISITDKLLKLCSAFRVFQKTNGFDIAIDYTDKPYHGDKNDEGIVGSKKEPHWAYRFATIDIIERGNAMTLFMLPYKELDTDEKIVRKLLEEAKKRIKIKCLYGDQEFSYACLIDIYDELDIEYIIRAKGSYIYRKEKKTDKPTWFEYPRKRYVNKNLVYTTTTWVICVFENKKGKTKKESYFTNKKVTHNNKNKFYLWYDKRWSIEIDYRSNNIFMPKTSAKKYVVRFFYFVLCSILRNIWVFINLKIKTRFSIKIRSKPVLSADDFIFLVFKIYNISV